MYHLARISIQNWGIFSSIDIDVRGSTALVGGSGTGKSTVQDAVQVVMAGADTSNLRLDYGAARGSVRTILGYCLGQSDQTDAGSSLREKCETLLALVFEHDGTREPLTVGIVLSARQEDREEVVISRFIAPAVSFSFADLVERATVNGDSSSWSDIKRALQAKSPAFEDFDSADSYVEGMLQRMFEADQGVDTKRLRKLFKHGLAFSPISDPTRFIREIVLDQDDLDAEWATVPEPHGEDGRGIEEASALLVKIGTRVFDAKRRLTDINARLADHRINGRTYTITSSVFPRFQRIYDLSMKAHERVEGRGATLEVGDLKEAQEQILRLGDVVPHFGPTIDYREILSFDIVITDADGRRTTASGRRTICSSGEALEPFYVILAATLSSTYFRQHLNGPGDGMGFLMLDSPFTRLDASSARTMMKLYRDLKLQTMVTALEDNGTSLPEMFDSVVFVGQPVDVGTA